MKRSNDTGKRLTRRAFLKTTAGAGAGAAAISGAGAKRAEAQDPRTWAREADVVVIGSGATRLASSSKGRLTRFPLESRC